MASESFDGLAPMMDLLAAQVAARFCANDNHIAIQVATRFKQALVIPREYHLPSEARGKAPLQPEGTDLFIWTWEKEVDTPKGPTKRYYAIAFAGKSNKPLWNYVFAGDASRQAEIDRTIANRKGVLKFKQDRLDQRKNYKHGLQVGDILESSWGYEQTNVNFYQVVEVMGSQIVVREIGSKTVDEDKNISHVVAVPNHFIGPALKRKPGLGGYVKIDGSQSAHKWDGKPVYETSSGWGH